MAFSRREAAVALEVSSLLVPRPSGVGVYGRSLIRGLRSLMSDRRVDLVFCVSRYSKRRHHPAPGLKLKPYVNGRLLHRRYRLLHTLDTRLPPRFQGKIVATVHDVLSALPLAREKDLSTARFRERKRSQYREIAARADVIVTVSEETRRQFCSSFDAQGPVEVVYPGVDPGFTPESANEGRLKDLGLGRGRYILSVGELCARKNLGAVVEAFLAIRRAAAGRGGEATRGLQLVLVGHPSFGWEESYVRRVIEEHRDCIHLLGFLSDQDLACVYAGAAAFVHLSHYEGFGLPILEAMAAGIPVVAARRGGIPEAAGDAALLVDPDQPAEAQRALREVLETPELARAKRAAGLARAAGFTWRACAERIAELYERIL